MTLTQERADILTEILTADVERAKNLFALESMEEALTQINALGNDFTLEELNEYDMALKASVKQGELNADVLDDVAGGVIPFLAAGAIALGSAAVLFGGSVAVGFFANIKK